MRQTSLTQLWGAFRLLAGTALVATAFVLRLDHSPTLAQQICSSPRVSRGGRRTALGAAQTASCKSFRAAAESRPSFANYSMRHPPSLPRRRPRGKLKKNTHIASRKVPSLSHQCRYDSWQKRKLSHDLVYKFCADSSRGCETLLIDLGSCLGSSAQLWGSGAWGLPRQLKQRK